MPGRSVNMPFMFACLPIQVLDFVKVLASLSMVWGLTACGGGGGGSDPRIIVDPPEPFQVVPIEDPATIPFLTSGTQSPANWRMTYSKQTEEGIASNRRTTNFFTTTVAVYPDSTATGDEVGKKVRIQSCGYAGELGRYSAYVTEWSEGDLVPFFEELEFVTKNFKASFVGTANIIDCEVSAEKPTTYAQVGSNAYEATRTCEVVNGSDRVEKILVERLSGGFVPPVDGVTSLSFDSSTILSSGSTNTCFQRATNITHETVGGIGEVIENASAKYSFVTPLPTNYTNYESDEVVRVSIVFEFADLTPLAVADLRVGSRIGLCVLGSSDPLCEQDRVTTAQMLINTPADILLFAPQRPLNRTTYDLSGSLEVTSLGLVPAEGPGLSGNANATISLNDLNGTAEISENSQITVAIDGQVIANVPTEYDITPRQ